MKLYAGVFLAIAIGSANGLHGEIKHAEAIKGESAITYHMSHPLHEFDAVSHDAVYRVDIDPEKKEVASVSVVVDVTTFDSGNSNRDSHAMEVIDAISYPDVRFVSTGIRKSTGDSVLVSGKLTFHGVTKEIVVPAALAWSSNKLDVRGAFDLSLTDFKIERPSLLMIPVADAVKFAVAVSFRWE
jgi:polyisoprenoid-binding protein YceI